MKVSKETIKVIKDSIDIVDVVSEYVRTLKKSGKNWVGLCPFHNDKKPSFSVSQDYKMYKCFSCGESGDVFRFIEKIEGISFFDVVVLLAKRAGVTLDLSDDQYSGKRNEVVSFNHRAAKLFNYFLLEKKEGQEGLKYLSSRGISNDIINTFSLGFAPKEFGRLYKIFQERGFSDDFLYETGLFSKGDRGVKTLMFNRIIFPIYNYMGECVGFGGRCLSDDVKPKYLNTPETVVYKKSQILYGINLAKDEMRKTGRGFLVEGYVDVIACHKNGVFNAVAPCGTAVTRDQIKLLSRFVSEIVLLLDGDEAGMKGALKALKEGVDLENVKFSVISLPNGLDPDDYFKKYSIGEFQNIVNNRMDAFDFCVKYVTRGVDLKDYNKLSEVLRYLFDYIKMWSNVIVRDLLLDRTSRLLSINSESLLSEFDKFLNGSTGAVQKKSEALEVVRSDNVTASKKEFSEDMKLEMDFLIYIHSFSGSREILQKSGFESFYFSSKYAAKLYDEALSCGFLKEQFIENIDNGFVLDYVTDKLMRDVIDGDEKLLKICIVDFLIDIMRKYWLGKSEEISEKIKLSEMYKDYDLVAELQQEKVNITGNIFKLAGLQELKK